MKSLEKRAERAGVRIKLGTTLSREIVEKERPDLLVVSSGARPAGIDVPGIDRPKVFNAWDILDGSVSKIGKQVVIVGGGAIGCETALFVANLDTLKDRAFAFLVYHEADSFGRLRELLYRTSREITVLEITEKNGRKCRPQHPMEPAQESRTFGCETPFSGQDHPHRRGRSDHREQKPARNPSRQTQSSWPQGRGPLMILPKK